VEVLGAMSTPTHPVGAAESHSGVLRRMGIREWWKCYSDGTTSIPINQIWTAERHSVVLRRIDMREW